MSTERRPREQVNAEAAVAIRRFAEAAERSMRALGVSFSVGTSFGRHRQGDSTAAAAAIAGLTQEERDALHCWARWLVGDGPE